jgi:DNA-binding protein HU-beta
MTKADLVERVVKTPGAEKLTKKAASEVVEAVFESLQKAIRKDRRFTYPGFGTFPVRKRAARLGRNPRTGEEIKIKPTKTVTFKPSPDLKSNL